MADLKRRRTALVRSLLGHDAPPQQLVLRGMANVEKILVQRFQEQNKERARLASSNALLRDKLSGLFSEDARWAAHARRRWQARRKSPPSGWATLRKKRQEKEHISLGSFGGTRHVPFDYQWSWNAITGPAILFNNSRVDASVGAMQIDGSSNFQGPEADQPGSISARAAVGIFFSSPSECLSNFSFWANPGFLFTWNEYCTLASAHSDGFIGLFAGSYDWAGNYTGTVVDQMISLWSNNSWWNDANGSGFSGEFSLSANFQVDPDHWYALWVWCGSDDSGEGYSGWISGSEAISSLRAGVSSIGWQVG